MKLPTPLRSVHLLTFTAALALAGCAAGSADAEVADVSEASDALEARDGDVERVPGHRHGHRGPESLATLALGELDLTDAQRERIEELLADEVPSFGGRRAAPPPGVQELAAAIRAGRVDVAALTRSMPPPAGRAEHHARVARSLDALHEILTPAQRARLVEVAADRPHPERRGAPDPSAGIRGDRPGHHDPLAMMLRDLDVGAAQKERIEAALVGADLAPSEDAPETHRAAHEARRKALLDAFSRDTFDASATLTPPEDRGVRGPERFLATLAVVVPLLDEGQRETLAARVEAGPPAPPGAQRPPR